MSITGIFNSERWGRVVKDAFSVDSLSITTPEGVILNLQCRKLLFVKIYGAPLPGTFTNYLNTTNSVPGFNEIEYWSSFVDYKLAALVVKKIYVNGRKEIPLPYNCSIMNSKGAFIPHSRFTDDLSYLPQKTRNIVRKGLKENIINQSTDEDIQENICKHFDNLSFTFSKQGKSVPHPMRAYQAIRDNLILGTDYFLYLSYSHDGEITGSALFLRESDTIIFHSGGNTSIGLKKAASSALQYTGHMLAKSLNLSYDFGGLGISSIDSFKMSFNPIVFPVTTYIFGNFIFRKVLCYVLFNRS